MPWHSQNAPPVLSGEMWAAVGSAPPPAAVSPCARCRVSLADCHLCTDTHARTVLRCPAAARLQRVITRASAVINASGGVASQWKPHHRLLQEKGSPQKIHSNASHSSFDTDILFYNHVTEKRAICCYRTFLRVGTKYKFTTDFCDLQPQEHGCFPGKDKTSLHPLADEGCVNATSQAELGQLPELASLLRGKLVDNGLLYWAHLQNRTCSLIFITTRLHRASFQRGLTNAREQQLLSWWTELVQLKTFLRKVMTLMKSTKLSFSSVVESPTTQL